MNDPKENGLEFNRRAFLRGTGAATAAVTLSGTEAGSRPVEAAAADDEVLGPGRVPVKLIVNGKELSAELEPRVTLLDALRDYLDVTGCKRVCDRGACGSCTVLLEGKAVYACSILAIDARGKRITTCEGLADGERLHPVQQAFWNRDASQCGFCTPGFVVACAAVLQKKPRASVEEIKRGLDGNICRCGTYEQMAHAIRDLAGTA
jgi:xanthine dehydrogenase YagT iron-sulfur-binding subunit